MKYTDCVREMMVETVSRSEIVHLDVLRQLRTTAQSKDVPWEWFGATQDDPTWDALFEDLERRRDATRREK
jgi:hypothetical protein